MLIILIDILYLGSINRALLLIIAAPIPCLIIPFDSIPVSVSLLQSASAEKSRRASSLLLGNEDYNDFNDNDKGGYSPQQPIHDFG